MAARLTCSAAAEEMREYHAVIPMANGTWRGFWAVKNARFNAAREGAFGFWRVKRK